MKERRRQETAIRQEHLVKEVKECKPAEENLKPATKVFAKSAGALTAQQRQFQDLMTSLGQSTEAMARVANQTATQQQQLTEALQRMTVARGSTSTQTGSRTGA